MTFLLIARLLSHSGCSNAYDNQVWSQPQHISPIEVIKTHKYGQGKPRNTKVSIRKSSDNQKFNDWKDVICFKNVSFSLSDNQNSIKHSFCKLADIRGTLFCVSGHENDIFEANYTFPIMKTLEYQSFFLMLNFVFLSLP